MFGHRTSKWLSPKLAKTRPPLRPWGVKPAHPAERPDRRATTAARPLLLGEEGTGDPVVQSWSGPLQPAADGGALPARRVRGPATDRGVKTTSRVGSPRTDRGAVPAGGVELPAGGPRRVPAGQVVDAPTDRREAATGRVLLSPLTAAKSPRISFSSPATRPPTPAKLWKRPTTTLCDPVRMVSPGTPGNDGSRGSL